MMLASDFLSVPLEIKDDGISVLCVENKELFRNIVGAFYDEYPEKMEMVFSDNYTPFKYKGNVCFIGNFYHLELTSAITKKIYENITSFCNEEMQNETLRLKAEVTSFMEKVIDSYDYDFNYNADFNLPDLFKMMNLKPDINNEDMLNSLSDFILLIKKYTSVKCFILLNPHLYFCEEELDVFYKEIVYSHIPVLMIENNANFRKSHYETVRIIDNDLCEIY